jgi:hypothetical protein
VSIQNHLKNLSICTFFPTLCSITLQVGTCCFLVHGCISVSASTQSSKNHDHIPHESIENKLERFLGSQPQTNFDLMPMSVHLKIIPWASGYWPDALGGISRRWKYTDVSASLFYPLPTEMQIKKMTSTSVANLSPAEKLDVLEGHYDMPTLKAVRAGEKYSVPEWTGLCDGVAMASTEFPEPDSVTLKNPDGIAVPFGSSDIKALLAFYSEKSLKNEIVQLGERCDAQEPTEDIASCTDISPLDFHLAIAHRLAVDKKPLMADVTWDRMVWNHALFAFDSKILERAGPQQLSKKLKFKTPESEIKEVVRLRTRVLANNYKVNEHWRKSAAKDKIVEKYWFYAFALDSHGHVKDSVWESYEHPDFVWKTTQSPRIENKTLLSLMMHQKQAPSP